MARRTPAHGGQLVSRPQTRGGLVMVVGLAVYIALHVGYLQVHAMRQRSMPVEPDDAYSYILTGPQLLECQRGCPAFSDLKEQFVAPVADYHVGGAGWMRVREYIRLFVPYHPLHAAILIAVHWTGASWESAYAAVCLIGAVLIGVALTRWLFVMVGPGAAGVAMLVLAFGHFQEQGLDAIVPSTLSMAMAMWAWSWILADKSWKDWALPMLIAAMVAMHSGALLWAAVTVAAFVWIRAERSRRFLWIAAGSSTVFLAAALVVARLQTSIGRGGRFVAPWMRDTESVTALLDNVATAGRLTAAWVLSFVGGANNLAGHVPIVIVVVLAVIAGSGMVACGVVGFRGLSPRVQRGVAILGFLLVGVTFGTVFYVMPGYPAPLFVRSWVFVAVLSAGLAAHGAWLLVERRALTGSRWSAVAVLALALVAVLRVGWGLHALSILHNSVVTRANLVFDPSQPTLLDAAARPPSSVLYLAETPLYFYLTHGGTRFGAVFYPAVARTSEAARWVEGNGALQFVVGLNPAAGLRLSAGDLLSIEGDSARACRLQFDATRVSPVLISWSGDDRRGAIRELLGADSSIAVNVPAGGRSNMQVEAAASAGVRVTGLRCDGQTTRWPWRSGITMWRSSAGGTPRAIRFDLPAETMFPNRAVQVMSDTGDTYLLQLRERGAEGFREP